MRSGLSSDGVHKPAFARLHGRLRDTIWGLIQVTSVLLFFVFLLQDLGLLFAFGLPLGKVL